MCSSDLGTDAKIVVNKAEVGLYYASLGLDGGGFSLAGVTDAADTVTCSKDLIKGEVCLLAGGNWLNNACISGSNANI